MPIGDVKPSPENDQLYRPVRDDDPEIAALAASIREYGVREPLVVSADGYLLSGHRRHAAARLAGLREVPVRVERVRRSADPDGFLTLLREFNRQRVKSFDEKLREAVIDADPEECRAELVEYRRARAKTGHVPFLVPRGRPRSEITEAKRPMVEAIQRVLVDLRDFWPLTVRQIHYQLLNNPLLRHASKPESGYRNDATSYKSAVDLTTRMRLVEPSHWAHIEMDAIGDETRPITTWDVHRDVSSFLTREVGRFLMGYARDLMASQPNHIEVVVEKNTVAGIVQPVCMEFCIPMSSGRGYSSLPPREQMARRFERSGKQKLIVIFVTDFDPEGENIAESFARSMRDDFGVTSIEPIKAALTDKQVRSLKLPPMFKVKETSSRAASFKEEHGDNVWELEALSPPKLQEVVRACVMAALDLDMLNTEQRAEAEDARRLRGIRETVRADLRSVVEDHLDDSDDDGPVRP
jgi:hypothetical protein